MTVQVHPGARREEVRKLDDGTLEVWTRAPAFEGRANVAVLRLACGFLKVAPSSARLLSGARGRTKIIEIDD